MNPADHPKNENDLPARVRAYTENDVRALPQELSVARKAAVLLPLLSEDGVWKILFEVRALDLDVQPGDVCFPGGGVEKDETPLDAVLREASEELFVDANKQIEILRALPEMIGPSGAIVTPFVGVLRDYDGAFFKGETDHVFTIPVDWFRSHPPRVHRMRRTPPRDADFPYELIHGGVDYPFRDAELVTYFYEYGDEVVWGFTAKVLLTFLTLCGAIER